MAVDLHKESRNFDRRLAELQAGIMEVRMVPLENLFERMVRVGRQIGRELKKKVRIVVSGAHTELDKLIVEDLSEPLMHIIRNALDHGLEGPDERLPPARVTKVLLNSVRLHKGTTSSFQFRTMEGVSTESVSKSEALKGNLSRLNGPRNLAIRTSSISSLRRAFRQLKPSPSTVVEASGWTSLKQRFQISQVLLM